MIQAIERPTAPARLAIVAPARGAGALAVTLRTGPNMAPALPAWRHLADAALQPSPFAEPELLLPALQHLAGTGRHIGLLVASRGENLAGLMPVLMPRLPLGRREVRLWRPGLESVPLPVLPLIARDGAEAVAAAMLGFLGERADRLVIPDLPTGCALDLALRGATLGSGRDLEEGRSRVGLGAIALSPPAGLAVERVREIAALRVAVEEFLALEARAAALRRQPALIQDVGAASFVRAATRQMARRRRCRVDLLRGSEGEVIAAAVLFGAGPSAPIWRLVARDETAAGWFHAASAPRRSDTETSDAGAYGPVRDLTIALRSGVLAHESRPGRTLPPMARRAVALARRLAG